MMTDYVMITTYLVHLSEDLKIISTQKSKDMKKMNLFC